MECIDENIAMQFVGGLLPAKRSASIEAHVKQCGECRWLISMAGSADGADGEPSVSVTSAPPNTLTSRDRPPALPNVGDVIRETYEVTKIIGIGGMATVYEVHHRHLGKTLAMKLLNPNLRVDPEAVTRLKREAQIMTRLHHPHIIEAYDFNYTEAGAPFIVMERLNGQSLSERLGKGRFIADLRTASEIVRQACSALSAAHQAGVIHRDLKPTNIFLCEDPKEVIAIKIMDFGISKILGEHSDLTGSERIIGSPCFMAPEQAQGAANVDRRTDVFAMGAIIFRMLTGHNAFTGATPIQTLYQVVHHAPNTPERWHQLPDAVKHIILKSISKLPEARYQSAAELATEFTEACASWQPESGFSAVSSIHTQTAANDTQRTKRAAKARRRAVIGLISIAAITLSAAFFARSLVTGKKSAVTAPSQPVSVSRRGSQSSDAAIRGPITQPLERTRVSITTRPSGALVFLDDRLAGSSPIEVDVSPETETQISIRKNGFSLWKRIIAPHGKPTMTISARLRRKVTRPVHRGFGSLTIQSANAADGRYVWADVYIDGRRVGQTPLTVQRIKAGRHRVELRHPGFLRVVRYLVIEKGRRSELSVKIRKR